MNDEQPFNASHEPISKALAETKPIAEHAFKDNLEEQLMTHLQPPDVQKEGKMLSFNKQKQKRSTRSRWSYTLVAAVLAIVIVGGLYIFIGQNTLPAGDVACGIEGTTQDYVVQEGDTMMSISQASGVPVRDISSASCLTDSDVIRVGRVLQIPVQPAAGQVSNPRPVMVANQDISYGDVITADMLTVDYRTPDTINAVYPFCCEEYIVGRVANEPIRSGVIIEERMLNGFDATPMQLQNNPHVGIIISHTGEDMERGAVCPDGLTEASVNASISEATALQLQRLGYDVVVFSGDDITIDEFAGDLIIEIHSFACTDDTPSGYLAGYNDVPRVDLLQACLLSQYENETGLSSLDYEFNPMGSSSYRLRDVDSTIPAVVLNTASLSANRTLFMETPERIVSGIVSTVSCFLPPSDYTTMDGNMTPMVIAKQDIVLNQTITPDMLTVIMVSWDFMNAHQPPESSFMNVLSSVDLAVGQVATRLIRKYEPVLMDSLSNPPICTAGEEDCSFMPRDYVAVTFSTDDDAVLALQPGMSVDVIASIQFVPVEEGEASDVIPETMLTRVVQNALLLRVDNDIILGVIPQDATVLTYLLDAGIPMTLAPSTPSTLNDTQTDFVPPFPQTDDGYAIISVPFDQVGGRAENIGDLYDVQFSMMNNNFASESETVGEGQVTTLVNAHSVLEINDSRLLYVGSGNETYPNPQGDDGALFIAITVDLADAMRVNWYLTNGARFTLSHDALATANQPDRIVSVALPIDEVTTIGWFVEGDVIDVSITQGRNSSDTTRIEGVVIRYIGNDRLEDVFDMPPITINQAGERADYYVVVDATLAQSQQILALIDEDSTITFEFREAE